MKTNTLLLCAAVLSLGACSSYGPYSSSGPRYTPRPEVSEENYTQMNRIEDHMDKKSYKEYEQREQCEQYRRLPRHYSSNCPSMEKIVYAEKPLPPILKSYTILFDFDKSNIRPDEIQTLDLIAREINKYNPREVTVTGFTDSSGNVDYNQNLSREREQAVSRVLMERGVKNRVLNREARGEYDQAVKTADGVRNQENRRVVVDFRR